MQISSLCQANKLMSSRDSGRKSIGTGWVLEFEIPGWSSREPGPGLHSAILRSSRISQRTFSGGRWFFQLVLGQKCHRRVAGLCSSVRLWSKPGQVASMCGSSAKAVNVTKIKQWTNKTILYSRRHKASVKSRSSWSDCSWDLGKYRKMPAVGVFFSNKWRKPEGAQKFSPKISNIF